MEKINIKDRKNDKGLRVISIFKPGSLMSVNLGFDGGAFEDSKDKKGITHFLEHMVFNGTINRSHDELNDELEYLGGDVDAYTDVENLVLSISGLNNELDKALDLISDMVLNSSFPENEILKEKNVILNEFREGQDDIEIISFDNLCAKAYPKEPLKFNVIGNESIINSFNQKDLINRFNELFNPSRAVMVIVSNEKHEDIDLLVNKYFGDWTDTQEGIDAIKNRKSKFIPNKKGTFNTVNTSFEMGSVAQLYTFKNLRDELEMPLKILNYKLGNSDNSILFKEVRLKRGLAYDIYSNLDLSKDIKALEIYTSVDSKEVEHVNEIINTTIEDLKCGKIKIENKTLELMKKIHKTTTANLIDDTYSLGSYVLSNALENKKLLRYEEEIMELEKVTLEDINEVIKEVFNNPTIHLLKNE